MYTISRASRALGIGSVVLTVAFLECADFVAPYAPVITNEVDNFAFQVSLTGVTTTGRYVWTNTGNGANVNMMSAVTAGTATLSITDADGALVYSHPLDGSGGGNTASGASGDWMVVVDLTNAVGTVHFTLQKP